MEVASGAADACIIDLTMAKAMSYVDDVDFRADLNLRLDDKKSDEDEKED